MQSAPDSGGAGASAGGVDRSRRRRQRRHRYFPRSDEPEDWSAYGRVKRTPAAAQLGHAARSNAREGDRAEFLCLKVLTLLLAAREPPARLTDSTGYGRHRRVLRTPRAPLDTKNGESDGL